LHFLLFIFCFVVQTIFTAFASLSDFVINLCFLLILFLLENCFIGALLAVLLLLLLLILCLVQTIFTAIACLTDFVISL